MGGLGSRKKWESILKWRRVGVKVWRSEGTRLRQGLTFCLQVPVELVTRGS